MARAETSPPAPSHPQCCRAAGRAPAIDADAAEIAVALRIRHGDHELTFISIVTTFGTAVDITVSELSIESFFPTDTLTAELLRTSSAG